MAENKKQSRFVASVDAIWRAMASNSMELIISGILILAFLKVPKLIQWLDPYSRAVDLSYLHLWIMKVMMFSASVVVTWLIVQFAFPTLDRYMSGENDKVSGLRRDWEQVSSLTRLLMFFGTVFFILGCILFIA